MWGLTSAFCLLLMASAGVYQWAYFPDSFWNFDSEISTQDWVAGLQEEFLEANFKFGQFCELVIQAFKYAAEPFFLFSNSLESRSPVLYAKVCMLLFFLHLWMIAISVNLDLVRPLSWRSPGYEKALHVSYAAYCYLLWGFIFNLSIWFEDLD